MDSHINTISGIQRIKGVLNGRNDLLLSMVTKYSLNFFYLTGKTIMVDIINSSDSIEFASIGGVSEFLNFDI